jgi:hypothetical protein
MPVAEKGARTPCLFVKDAQVAGYIDFADGTRFTKYMSNRKIWIDKRTRTTKERRNARGTNAAVMPSSLGKKMSIAKPVPKIRPTKMGIHQALSGCGKIDGSRSPNTISYYFRKHASGSLRYSWLPSVIT